MARKMIDFSGLDSEQLKEFKNRYDAYIFDFDETLIHQNGAPIEGVEEALNEIAKNGKSIMVLTDNCLYPYTEIAERVNGLFPVIKQENVMTAGRLVVRYLKEINLKKKVYAIGSVNGLIADLKNFGFDVLYDHEFRTITVPDLRSTKFEEGVGAVVVASDINCTYFKVFKAANYLADPEVILLQSHIPEIIAYNPLIPAAGTLISAVKAGSGRKESTIVGKGSEYCSTYLRSIGFPVERCLFVGDGAPNDVVAGNKAGMDTMLVLTGASSLESVEIAKSKNLENQIPTYYTNSVADLIRAFKN